MTSVSVVLASSGRINELADTLRSLAQVTAPASAHVELILIESATQCGAKAVLADCSSGLFKSVQYCFEPVRGKSRALNLALERAASDVLLFTDDDVRFPCDWIERMCAPIWGGQADAVAGGVRLAPHLLRPWMNRTHRAWLASTADYLDPRAPSEMCGANMAVSRQVLDRIGGFDTELGPGVTCGGEESLLSWQLKEAGFRIAAAFDVAVEHHPLATRLNYSSWVRTARLKGETRAYLLHHWFHSDIPAVGAKRLLLAAKLAVRRRLTPRHAPGDEGIEPWELSYEEELALFTRFARERRRPRNYTRKGLRKLLPAPAPLSA